MRDERDRDQDSASGAGAQSSDGGSTDASEAPPAAEGDSIEDRVRECAPMPFVKFCTIAFKDNRGLAHWNRLDVEVGGAWASTARAFDSAMDIELHARKQALAADRRPRVTSVRVGSHWLHTVNADSLQPSHEAAKAVHAFISEHVSSQFGLALDLLISGSFGEANRVVEGILMARPVMDARDLNRGFTNRGMAMCISSIATIASGLETFNTDPDIMENRVRAREMIIEGCATIGEALEGKDETGTWWLGGNCEQAAGITLRENLVHIGRAANEARDIMEDYISKTPILDD